MAESYTILYRPRRPRSSSDSALISNLNGAVAEDENYVVETLDLEAHQAADLSNSPDVEGVASQMPITLISPLAGVSGASNDDWGVRAVQADTSAYTGLGVKVAVLDTGIERSHPAFTGIAIEEKDFTGSGDGDSCGHGTHCAGTIFGRDINGERIGIARGVTDVIAGKILDNSGRGTSAAIFDGINWAINRGAEIVSMSVGFDFAVLVDKFIQSGMPNAMAVSKGLIAYRDNLRLFDSLMGSVKAQAVLGRNPVIIAAAGNASKRSIGPNFRVGTALPADADGIISVAAVGRSGSNYAVADFSNSNPVLSGPGENICSAWIGGVLRTMSGTSMACPHVAGVAALWHQKLTADGERLTTSSITNILISRARSNVFEGHSDFVDVGHGLVTAP